VAREGEESVKTMEKGKDLAKNRDVTGRKEGKHSQGAEEERADVWKAASSTSTQGKPGIAPTEKKRAGRRGQ